METERLRYFCAIVDSGSLTGAADLLGVSHSGLSKAMTALQDEIGFKLFIPKGRGLETTDQGKSFYENSLKILEMVSALKAQKVAPPRMPRIALPEAIALTLSQALTREMGHGISIEQIESGTLASQIANRKLDFAFTFVPYPHNDLEHLKITPVSLVSVARTNRFLNVAPTRIPYVIPSSNLNENPLGYLNKDGWNPHLERYAPFRAGTLSIALQMMQSGTCAVYIPKFLIAHLNASASSEKRISELALDARRKAKERNQLDIFLVKRRHDEESAVLKNSVKLLRKLCRD